MFTHSQPSVFKKNRPVPEESGAGRFYIFCKTFQKTNPLLVARLIGVTALNHAQQARIELKFTGIPDKFVAGE